jgi:hypothetical protein
MSGQLQTPAALSPIGERALGTNWIGSQVGPRTGLENVEKRKFLPLQGLEHRLGLQAVASYYSD